MSTVPRSVEETTHDDELHDNELLSPGTPASMSVNVSIDEDEHNSSESDWRERRSWIEPMMLEIELGVQERKDCDGVGDEETLCRRCDALDIGALFSRCPKKYFEGVLVSRLGEVDGSWEKRLCPMCRLMAAVCPHLEHAAECELRAYSSNHL